MSIFDKLFGRQGHTNEKKTIPTLDEFTKLSAEDRMGVIMVVGGTGKSEYFPFMKYAVLNDTDLPVKLAAFKRIHLFKDNPEVVPMLIEIKTIKADKISNPTFPWRYRDLGSSPLQNLRK